MAHLYFAAFLTLATFAQLSVAQEPFLQLLPNKILKAVGQGVYVSCSAKVDNPELVTEMSWFGPTDEQIPGSDQTVGTLDDGTAGKLDLMIEKLRDQDTGNYTCTATYAGNQMLTSVVLIESFMDISFGDTPLHQTPIIHTEATIQCMPMARPPPQVDWLKDMIPLKNDENHIIQQDGVLIKNVSLADEGTYRCRARVLELGSMKYKDIQVEVYVKPEITEAPTDTKGVEKETVTFNCKASGKPVPSYSWVDKDNRPLLGVEDFFVDPEEGILTIMNLKPEHTGNYRCTASNPVGDAFHSAFLQVLTKPKIEQYLNITGAVDSEMEMRCVVSGNPAPEVAFKKETNDLEFNQGYNEDDRISVTQEQDEEGRQVGILKINKLSRSDDGLYTCTGKSEGGVTQAWGHITTEFKPNFEDQPFLEIWSWNQAPINLTCLATSIPNATIQWYLRNNEIDANDPNLQVMSLGPNGVLRVNPLSTSYFGDYTCQATNTLGMTELNIELKEAHVPGPISHSQVDKKTATTITWSLTDPADDGGLAIQGYVVQYRLRDTNWDQSEERFWTKGGSYTLDGLAPMETYVFRFAARSEAGIGEWGGEKDEEMPRHAQPEEPLIFNSKPGVNEIPYSSYYTLQWKVPLDNGREIDYFQISYFQVKNASGTWEAVGSKTTEQIEHPGVSSFKIEDLRANAHYKIELRAHNDIGYSTPAEIIIKTANDPSATESGIAPGGTSVHLSSSAPPPPSTTNIMSTPAHGPDAGSSTGGDGLGTGIIVAIIIIALIILVVVIDVTCYFTKNAGLTAKIAGKRGQTDKDKEAMLEDGKNTSADTLNAESREDVKPLEEKPVPEKEPQKPTEKSLDIISEKESEDKVEGNGQMKSPKEEDAKKNDQAPEDKTKDNSEPTETTPMIQQGEKEDKEAIIKEEQEEKEGDKLKKSGSKTSVTKDSPV